MATVGTDEWHAVKQWLSRWVAYVGVRRLVAGGGAALAGSVVVWLLVRPSGVPVESMLPLASNVPVVTPSSTAVAPGVVKVHVAGAVRNPGVYQLASSARVVDAVLAAGGATSRADLESINLAQTIVDTEQVYVPARRASRPRVTVAPRLRPNRRADQPSPSATSTTASGQASTVGGPVSAARINLNSATASQLDTLPGVGPTTARAIISYRTKHGPFTKVEDLLNVTGIGPSKLAAMRDRVSV